MFDLTPGANAFLRKFSTAEPGWFRTEAAKALIAKVERAIATQDGEEVAKRFMERLALIEVTA